MTSRSLSHEDMLERGISQREASRLVVRENFQLTLEIAYQRLGAAWLCLGLILVVGMFVVVVWSQTVYDAHYKDACDTPLALMLRLIIIFTVTQGFQKEIIRYILCYDLARDGPSEPCRVKVFKRFFLVATMTWLIAAVILLYQTTNCSQALKTAVTVIVAYYMAVMFVLLVLPAIVLLVFFFLLRQGMIAVRSPTAAPEDLINQIPQVDFSQERFDDEASFGFPSSCPVCLDTFEATKPISKTPCEPSAHVFHTDCLRGWLQVSSSCPLCRQDLVAATSNASQKTAPSSGGGGGGGGGGGQSSSSPPC